MTDPLADGGLILQILVMAVTLPIGRMSREDKLRAMEALWVDLSRDEAQMQSPAWHETVLRETEQLVREGKAKFSDWSTARRRLRRKAKELHAQAGESPLRTRLRQLGRLRCT